MATLTAETIRDVNARYHDVAADGYDAKWGIDFGPVGRSQTLIKFAKAVGSRSAHFGDALEIGSGTGYFSLNLMQAGVIDHATCTDISPGMLATLAANASRHDLVVETVATDAEELPFADHSFDLVFGHAVLHHLPDLDRAFAEFFRVLRPGGTLVFAGEPSRYGDQLAEIPKRTGRALAPLWRRALGVPAAVAQCQEDHSLEGLVDIHAFAPGDLRGYAERAGFTATRVRGEELLANWFGWTNRVLESSAEAQYVPWGWRQYAYRGYLALQRVDRGLLEPRLPAGIFYNLMIAARRPV